MSTDRRRREAAGERERELSRRERKRVPSRARLTCAHDEGGQRTAHRSARVHARALRHEQREREGRTRVEMSRSRSTPSSCTARHAFPPVVRDRPAREGLESAHHRVVEATRRAGVREARVGRGARERRRGGRGRTCSPTPAEPTRPTRSAPCTFLSLVEGRARVWKPAPVSREVGSTRFADEDASRWLWAVGEGAWWCGRSTEVLESGAGRQARPKSCAQSGGRVDEERGGA